MATAFEASRAQREEVARRFFAAADGGDLDGLLRALAPDVVYYGDGGGKERAVAAALHGRDRVARFLAGLFRRIRKLEASLRIAEANGQPGAVTYHRDGHVVNVFALDIADGEVQAIRCVVNPDKLRHLGRMSELARELPRKLVSPSSPGHIARSPRRRPRPGPGAGRRPRAGSIRGSK